MNWLREGQLSSTWLNWIKQMTGYEGGDPSSSLRHVVDGLERWDAEIARDRHSTGDPDRIAPNEYFIWAAVMVSRAARQVVEQALEPAVEWHVADPMQWPDIDMNEARLVWRDSHHVIVNVTAAWAQMWQDLAQRKDHMSAGSQQELLDQWAALAQQATDIVEGVGVASWAQCRRD